MHTTIHHRPIVWIATLAVLAMLTLTFSPIRGADADPGEQDSTFVPIPNCRLFDTRSGPDNVGPKSTPLGPGAANVYTKQVTGTNGNCTIPDDAVAVAMNVTIVNPTAPSNLRIYPGDLTEVPLASNLNWVAGQAPTPNKVDVKLSPTGSIRLFNQNGTVDVLADIVGYYTDSSLLELQAQVDALRAAQPFADSGFRKIVPVGPADTVIASVEVTAPSDGSVLASSTASVIDEAPGGNVRCSITTISELETDFIQWWQSGGTAGGGDTGQLAGTRVFPIQAGDTVTYQLVCDSLNAGGNSADVRDATLTVLFTPGTVG